jgi:phospholipase/carboxylesterase
MPTLRSPFLFLVALSLAAAPAIAQPAGEEIDVLGFRPGDLSIADREGVLRNARAAYLEEDYENAARDYIRALRMQPGDANSLYNLACCYGLLGHAEPAAAFLEAAWTAGFKDLGHLTRDPDFDEVREAEPFRKVVAALEKDAEKRQKLAGRRLPVTAEVVADVRVLEPEEMPPFRRLPVLIGLHGFGDNVENFAALFEKRGIERDFLYCAVQAPYAFLPGARVGYSWGIRDEGASRALSLRSHRLSIRLVLRVLEALRREYPIDERNVFLMGFSQGAGMAFCIGMKHPEKFRGVIPVGGWLDPGEYSATEVARARKLGNFLVCHSPEDRMVPFDSAEEAKIFLAESGISHRLLSYPGGHSLPEDLLEQIVRWMKAPEAASTMKKVSPEEK